MSQGVPSRPSYRSGSRLPAQLPVNYLIVNYLPQ
jgi:hypothetical protein